MMNRGIFDSRLRRPQAPVPLKQAFEAALHARGVALAECTLLGHPARCYDPAARHSAPRVLLAGDAVGCDPLLGEGITSALGLGILAAETAVDGLARDDLRFRDYERRIRTSAVGRWLRVRRLTAHVFYGRGGRNSTLGALWLRARARSGGAALDALSL